MIRINCPKCQKKLGLDDALAGNVGTCPACSAKFRVPKPAAAKSTDPNRPAPDSGIKPAKPGPEAKTKPAAPAKEAAIKSAAASRTEMDDEDSTPYVVVSEPAPPPEKKKKRKIMTDDEIAEIGVDKGYAKSRKKKTKSQESAGVASGIWAVAAVGLICVAASLLTWFKPDAVLISLGLGGLVQLVGWVWLLTVAHNEGFMYGVLCFFLPLVGGIVMLVMNPAETLRPFVIWFGGLLIMLFSLLIAGRHFVQSKLNFEESCAPRSMQVALFDCAVPIAGRSI